jgi:hypothetical protein
MSPVPRVQQRIGAVGRELLVVQPEPFRQMVLDNAWTGLRQIQRLGTLVPEGRGAYR